MTFSITLAGCLPTTACTTVQDVIKLAQFFFSNTLFSKNWHPTRCYITDKSPLSRLRWNDFNCLFDNTVRLKMARQWALEHSDFQSLKLKQFSMIKQFSIVFLQKKTMYIPYGLLFCTSARFSLPISRHMMTKTNIYIRISMNGCLPTTACERTNITCRTSELI